MKKTLSGIIAAFAAIFTTGAVAGQGEKVDVPAPEVSGLNQDGKEIKFADLYAKGPTVIFFYPKASTPG